MEIRGVLPPIATPWDSRGQLDRGKLVENIERWNSTGLRGYVVAGSNGESALLETEEAIEIVRVARDAATSDKLVIAGTGRQSTQATVQLTRAAADAGADAALVLTPFFYGGQMTPEALTCHYTTIADASPIPVIIYNVPKFTHLNIAPATVAALAGHERIVGIKDSAGNIGQIIDLVRLCPPEFSILVGNGPAFYSAIEAGASGAVLALANVAAKECVAVYDCLCGGDSERAKEIHYRLMDLARAVTSGFGISGLKAAMDLVGLHGGMPRPPLLPLADAAREAVHRIVEASGVDPIGDPAREKGAS